MIQWYYNDGGQQKGPISLDELKVKIAANQLNSTSLVWQVGTKDWAEVQSFPGLVEQIHTPPPLPTTVTIAAGSRSVGLAVVDALPSLGISIVVAGIFLAIAIHKFKENAGLVAISILAGIGITVALVMALSPKRDVAPPSFAWRRFIAKLLDVEVALLVGLIAVAVFSPESFKEITAVFLCVSLGTWFLFEVPMKGKTLGRYLFGVHLSPDPGKDTPPSYFFRFIRLSFFGFSLGIPVASAITASLSYKRLRETGTTKWDDGFFIVEYRNGIGLPATGIFLLLVLIGAQAALQNVLMNQDTTPQIAESAPSEVRQAAEAPMFELGNKMRDQSSPYPTNSSGAMNPAKATWINPKTGISVAFASTWNITNGTGEFVRHGDAEIIDLAKLEDKSIGSYISLSILNIPSSYIVEMSDYSVLEKQIGVQIYSTPRLFSFREWTVALKAMHPKKRKDIFFIIDFGKGNEPSYHMEIQVSKDFSKDQLALENACDASINIMMSSGFPSKEWLNDVIRPICFKQLLS